MYRCLFEVLGLILSLTAFQCALLEHLNVTPSQLHPNSWAMVRAFEILCPFSTFGLVYRSSCFSFKWSWLQDLVRFPWTTCPRSCLSLIQTSFPILRTISLRSWLLVLWLMVCHWCSTGTGSPASILLAVWPYQVQVTWRASIHPYGEGRESYFVVVVDLARRACNSVSSFSEWSLNCLEW